MFYYPLDYIDAQLQIKSKPVQPINFLKLFETLDCINPEPILYESLLPDQFDEECVCGLCNGEPDGSPEPQEVSLNLDFDIQTNGTFDLSKFDYCQPCSDSDTSNCTDSTSKETTA